ncbi:MAG: hypothetical protein ACJ75S_05800 [Solirubrobacterales bacterium]
MTIGGHKVPTRVYEKGVDRHKHVGTSDYPEIIYRDGLPKYAIGKCPRGVPDAVKAALLNEAIPAANGDRELDFPKRLHVVHEGAVYRAETTTAGQSYHAFPYAGKLGKGLVTDLAAMADRKGCRGEFDKWVAKYIKLHGK